MKISVIICTHNPREDYLKRTLDGLEQQTLPKDQWELLLIDNASDQPLSKNWDLEWHPHGRHIMEQELGLTPARLCGIREAGAELLVFVDDDNVLNTDYLENAYKLSQDHPRVAAFGGSCLGEFEREPDPDTMSSLGMLLCTRKVTKATWACMHGIKAIHAAPAGAGMVIRKCIALSYANRIENDPIRKSFGRTGTSLSSCEDTDMVFCCYEEDYGVGLFPELVLTHLISSSRLEKAYLLRLAEGIGLSYFLLTYVWHQSLPPAPQSKIDRCVNVYKRVRQKLSGHKFNSYQEDLQKVRRKAASDARSLLIKLD